MCAVLLLSMIGAMAQTIPPRPNPPRLVNDYVGVLDSNTVQKLEHQLVDYNNKTSIQIAVVIIDKAEPDVASVAPEIEQQWGVGQKGLDNGIVLLVAMSQRKIFIATGYGIEDFLNSATCIQIHDHMRPDFKQGNYVSGIQKGVNEIIQRLGPASWQQRQAFIAEQKRQQEMQFQQTVATISWGIGFLVMGLLVVLVIRWLLRKNNYVKNVVELITQNTQKAMVNPIAAGVWPQWAQDEIGTATVAYATYEKICKANLQRLPHFFFTRVIARTSRLQQYVLDVQKLVQIHALLAKVQRDIIFYNNRAEGAVAQAQQSIQETKQFLVEHAVQLILDQDAQELKKLELLSRDLEDLQKTEDLSRKDLYVNAFHIAEKVDQMKKFAVQELDAREKLEQFKVDYQRTSQDFESMKSRYQEKLLEMVHYPSTAATEIDSLAAFTVRIDDIKSKYDNILTKLKKPVFGDWANILLRVNDLQKTMTQVEERQVRIQDRITTLNRLKVSYPTRKKVADEALVAAMADVADSDVGVTAHNHLRESQKLVQQVKQLVAGDKVDWILVLEKVEESIKKSQAASAQASDDKSAAAQSRAAAIRAAAIETTTTSDFTSDTNTGSFGGFGGGDFSGGGGGGDW